MIKELLEILEIGATQPIETHNQYTVIHSTEMKKLYSRAYLMLKNESYPALLNELIEMSNLKLDSYNEYVYIDCKYKRDFSRKVLATIDKIS